MLIRVHFSAPPIIINSVQLSAPYYRREMELTSVQESDMNGPNFVQNDLCECVLANEFRLNTSLT